jgi:hypothetical protein
MKLALGLILTIAGILTCPGLCGAGLGTIFATVSGSVTALGIMLVVDSWRKL